MGCQILHSLMSISISVTINILNVLNNTPGSIGPRVQKKQD